MLDICQTVRYKKYSAETDPSWMSHLSMYYLPYIEYTHGIIKPPLIDREYFDVSLFHNVTTTMFYR